MSLANAPGAIEVTLMPSRISRAGDYVVGDTITVDGGLVHASLGTSIDA